MNVEKFCKIKNYRRGFVKFRNFWTVDCEGRIESFVRVVVRKDVIRFVWVLADAIGSE